LFSWLSLVRIVLALALAGAAVALIAVALNHLIRAGTCASGGPYQSTRECPKGTGTWMFVIPPALIALFAAPILSGRGATAGRIMWFGGFVALGINAIVLRLDGGLGPDAGSRFGAVFLAITFLAMGLIPGAVWTVSWFMHRGDREPTPDSAAPAWRPGASGSGADVVAQLETAAGPGGRFAGVGNATGMQNAVLAALAQSGIRSQAVTTPSPGEDPLDRLEKLARLREEGVLSDAEFAAQKARILGGT
jgi:hypothetical protein